MRCGNSRDSLGKGELLYTVFFFSLAGMVLLAILERI